MVVKEEIKNVILKTEDEILFEEEEEEEERRFLNEVAFEEDSEEDSEEDFEEIDNITVYDGIRYTHNESEDFIVDQSLQRRYGDMYLIPTEEDLFRNRLNSREYLIEETGVITNVSDEYIQNFEERLLKIIESFKMDNIIAEEYIDEEVPINEDWSLIQRIYIDSPELDVERKLYDHQSLINGVRGSLITFNDQNWVRNIAQKIYRGIDFDRFDEDNPEQGFFGIFTIVKSNN